MVIMLQPEPVTLNNSQVYVNPKCKPSPVLIPVVNLTDQNAKTQIVKACEELGFFRVVNHGVQPELLTQLEEEAVKFFALPQSHKDKAGPADPFRYGSKRIGPNGDVGWIEYILLNANSDTKTTAVFRQTTPTFRETVEVYMEEMKDMSSKVLEMVAEELKIEPKEKLSRLVRVKESDSCLRMNHYPEKEETPDKKEVGFGEHTDPQLVSVLRSNDTEGLQICLKDGTWVDVPPDHSSFFVFVGDTLQVMTNGRFKSVKHRVLTNTKRSRLSMIYFAGPPLTEKIAPLSCLVPKQEDWLYKEFTWSQYKSAAYKTKLGDYRLGPFEKQLPFSISSV
ncbi:Gibberellin 2-beta-dioxygenase 3 [Raphanus sativus]|uniref:gibberellin 2beta-dioxygenase n=1 Tax=Raphanus sativus TaxID=3726 RepID=A0A9W3DD59_RAPSA|nr:gibberellin 2-beta-dioxygenase 3-like [Raphanus sativus]KAJ4907095.1 Gibberellin 2-beta-dioxygenase 3 [Raphanus sativus]